MFTQSHQRPKVRSLLISALLFVTAVMLCCGCEPGNATLYEQLQNEKPSIRVGAIITAARLKDAKAVPYLIDRLTDSERSVRFYAIMSLEKITGETMGYRHYDPPARRAEAVARWRRWLNKRSGKKPADRQAKGNGQ